MSRKDDKRIAEILGMDWVKSLHNAPVIPQFTTDPAADYLVLEYMQKQLFSTRYEWERAMQDLATQKHGRNLREHESIGWRSLWVFYRPGDYSRALLAIKQKVEDLHD